MWSEANLQQSVPHTTPGDSFNDPKLHDALLMRSMQVTECTLSNHVGLLADHAIDLKPFVDLIPTELRRAPEQAPLDALNLTEGGAERDLKALLATVDVGVGQAYTAVVLPADPRCVTTASIL